MTISLDGSNDAVIELYQDEAFTTEISTSANPKVIISDPEKAGVEFLIGYA